MSTLQDIADQLRSWGDNATTSTVAEAYRNAERLVRGAIDGEWKPEHRTRQDVGLPAPRGRIGRAGTRDGSIVHCPGSGPAVVTPKTTAEAEALIRSVRTWHNARGWIDIGYHFAVWRGWYWSLRDVSRDGAHCKGMNHTRYGVLVLVAAEDEADDETLRTLGWLLDSLGGVAEPHRKYARKACPGDSVAAWLEERNR